MFTKDEIKAFHKIVDAIKVKDDKSSASEITRIIELVRKGEAPDMQTFKVHTDSQVYPAFYEERYTIDCKYDLNLSGYPVKVQTEHLAKRLQQTLKSKDSKVSTSVINWATHEPTIIVRFSSVKK